MLNRDLDVGKHTERTFDYPSHPTKDSCDKLEVYPCIAENVDQPNVDVVVPEYRAMMRTGSAIEAFDLCMACRIGVPKIAARSRRKIVLACAPPTHHHHHHHPRGDNQLTSQPESPLRRRM